MADRGRPRTFDRDRALGVAMEMFWSRGYDTTSIGDLTEAMGIRPPSLYAAFGSKEALFQEAAALYENTVGLDIWTALDEEPAIRGAVETFLRRTARSYARLDRPGGCLIALSDPRGETAGRAREDLKVRRAANLSRLHRRFERAVAEGELPESLDTGAAAAFYAALQHGMSILARDGAGAAVLEGVAATGTRALEGLTAAARPDGAARAGPDPKPRNRWSRPDT